MEPPIVEPPMELPPDLKKVKRMKLDQLNRKIRHSKKKNNGLIHKRNSLRKVIEGLKGLTSGDLKRGTKPEPMPEPEWNFKEHERAFRGAYRSYRVNGRPKMDVDTFFSRIREKLIELIKRELTVLNSARAETTTWIRFIKVRSSPQAEDDARVELTFNSRMTDVH